MAQIQTGNHLDRRRTHTIVPATRFLKNLLVDSAQRLKIQLIRFNAYSLSFSKKLSIGIDYKNNTNLNCTIHRIQNSPKRGAGRKQENVSDGIKEEMLLPIRIKCRCHNKPENAWRKRSSKENLA